MLLATATTPAANSALGRSTKPAITLTTLVSKRCPPRALPPAALIKAPAFILAPAANAAAGARPREASAPSTSLAQQWAGIAKPSKKLAASVLAIVAVIWPYLADIVREVIRWIHAH